MRETTLEEEALKVAAKPIDPGMIGADDVARFLSVSTRTLRTLDAKGEIPRPRLRLRTPRWSLAELQAWARAGCPPRRDWEAIWSKLWREMV